jgi:enoyl-CoA hydratase/carnithine racemase
MSLLDSPPVREAARALIAAVAEKTQKRAFSPHAYRRALRQIERQRGRELEAGFSILEKALTRVAENRGLPC